MRAKLSDSSHRVRPPTSPPSGRRGWMIPAALILLSALPLTFGALRLIELAGGPARMPRGSRFLALPLPVTLHIVSVNVYALLGAGQFAGGFRRRWPGWHRAAGRVVVLSGLLVGLSALWMLFAYPRAVGTGGLLFGLRLVVGLAMLGCIGLGVMAIHRRDVPQHRAWMMRAYALAVGAGTQVFTAMVGVLLLGPPTPLSSSSRHTRLCPRETTSRQGQH